MRNLWAMMVRRSLAVMSSKEGWVLVVYQRARVRCSSVSAGWWPVSVYQAITTV